MTIPHELAARIERLYTVEHWRVGTIARQLNVHRDTVSRVLRAHGATRSVARSSTQPAIPLRPSLIEPYRAFIGQTLAAYSTLTASRLHDMVRERGYTGQPSHFRFLVLHRFHCDFFLKQAAGLAFHNGTRFVSGSSGSCAGHERWP